MSDLRRKVEVKFDVLKRGVKDNSLSVSDIDDMTCELITFLAVLTERGITQINEKKCVDQYKERVWNIVENAGLLPEL
jgi:hypothetical protein